MRRLIIIYFSFLSITGFAQIPSMCDLTYKDSLYWWHDSIYSGQIIQYHKNSKIAEKGQLKNGVPDSVWFGYNKRGKLKIVIAFYKGKFSFRKSFSFLDDEPSFGEKNWTCPYYEFYRDEALYLEGNYVNGEKQGIWREYYSNGRIYQEKYYDNGDLQYPYYYWDVEGVKYAVGGSYVTKNGIIVFTTFKKTKIK